MNTMELFNKLSQGGERFMRGMKPEYLGVVPDYVYGLFVRVAEHHLWEYYAGSFVDLANGLKVNPFLVDQLMQCIDDAPAGVPEDTPASAPDDAFGMVEEYPTGVGGESVSESPTCGNDDVVDEGTGCESAPQDAPTTTPNSTPSGAPDNAPVDDIVAQQMAITTPTDEQPHNIISGATLANAVLNKAKNPLSAEETSYYNETPATTPVDSYHPRCVVCGNTIDHDSFHRRYGFCNNRDDNHRNAWEEYKKLGFFPAYTSYTGHALTRNLRNND